MMIDNFFKLKEMKRKFFSYMGSKERYKMEINNIINRSAKDLYCEPFLGSGFIFLNLEKKFNEYHIAEKNKSLMNIFKQFYLIKDLDVIYKLYDDLLLKFNICTKDGYYEFRDYFNSHFFNTDSLEEAFYLVCLISCSINNMCRFGKNGYNTSFGSGFFTLYKVNVLRESIRYFQSYKNVFFYNDVFDILDKEGCLFFLDPPYLVNKMAQQEGWNEELLIKMFNVLKLDKNDVIYSDNKNMYGDNNFRYNIKLDKTKNIRPLRKEEKVISEVLYYNF